MGIISIVFNLIFTVIGAILSVFIGKLIRQNGRVLEKMEEGFKKMDERAEQRHREVIELIAAIKKGS